MPIPPDLALEREPQLRALLGELERQLETARAQLAPGGGIAVAAEKLADQKALAAKGQATTTRLERRKMGRSIAAFRRALAELESAREKIAAELGEG
jgi:hypothetical protein